MRGRQDALRGPRPKMAKIAVASAMVGQTVGADAASIAQAELAAVVVSKASFRESALRPLAAARGGEDLSLLWRAPFPQCIGSPEEVCDRFEQRSRVQAS